MAEVTLDEATSERIARVYAAFLDTLRAGFQPAMTASIQSGNDWRRGEYDLLVGGQSDYGVIHEEIVKLVEIAERHGGRVWLQRRDKDALLAILFPYERTPGPDGGASGSGEAPAETERRRSRKGKS